VLSGLHDGCIYRESKTLKKGFGSMGMAALLRQQRYYHVSEGDTVNVREKYSERLLERGMPVKATKVTPHYIEAVDSNGDERIFMRNRFRFEKASE
jgi:hypothetical protein